MVTEKKYILYRHINKINGGIYIGQTCRKPESRWGKNGNGYKGSTYFYNAIQKYGWNNFEHEILFEGLTFEEVNEKEKWWIAYYRSIPNQIVYNLESGGSVNKFHSEKTKQKISKANKGKYVGEKNPMYGVHRFGINNPNYGNHHSEEAKRKIGESKKEKYIGEKNPNYGNRGANNPISKKVLQINKITGEIIKQWDCIKEAKEELKINTNISSVCKGKRKTAGGFIWRYAN